MTAPEKLVKENGDELIAGLVTSATGNAPIEIRFEDADDDEWSVFTLYDYDGGKELSLRLHANGLFDLHVGCYDDGDEFIEAAEPLSAGQKAILPEKLKRVMKKVLDDEAGIRLPGSLLK